MIHTNTFIGLDVHARSIKAVALDVITGEVRSASFLYDYIALAEWIRSLPQPTRCVYESGVTGFDLQKKLASSGIDCVVGAVSKMFKPAADRKRKNDRNDAEFLARMLSVGNITAVWIPDDECEAARDLIRALEDAREECIRSKQILSKFLLRHGLVFNETSPTGRRIGNWTLAHWRWIRSITLSNPAANDTFLYYIDRVKASTEEKKRLEALVREEAARPRWKKRVDTIRCLKGIDLMTAADLVFKLMSSQGSRTQGRLLHGSGLYLPSIRAESRSVKEESRKLATGTLEKRSLNQHGTTSTHHQALRTL